MSQLISRVVKTEENYCIKFSMFDNLVISCHQKLLFWGGISLVNTVKNALRAYLYTLVPR